MLILRIRPALAVRRVTAFAFAVLTVAFAGDAGADQVLRVAFIDPLSGPAARDGAAALAQLRRAAERENARRQGRGPRLEIVAFDNRGEDAQTRLQLRHALDAGIRLVVQGQGEDVGRALADALAAHNAREPAAPVLLLDYGEAWTGPFGTGCTTWHFRFGSSLAARVHALLSVYAAASRTIFLVDPDLEHGRPVERTAASLVAALVPANRVVMAAAQPAARGYDPGAHIRAAMAARADVILTGHTGRDLVGLVRAAAAGGFAGPVLSPFEAPPEVTTAMGAEGVGRFVWITDRSAPRGAGDGAVASEASSLFTLIDMLGVAVQRHPGAGGRALASALAGMRIATLAGPAEMRVQDLQLVKALYVRILQRATADHTRAGGTGPRTEWRIHAGTSALPAPCALRGAGT